MLRPRVPAEWALIATASFAVAAGGSVDTVPLLITALLALATLVLSIRSFPLLSAKREIYLLTGVCIGLTAFTAVQALPLPRGLVAILSPHAAGIWRTALEPFSQPAPRWQTLSLDPQATRVQVLRGLLYAATFLASWALARERKTAFLLERALIALGVAVALAAIVHEAFGLKRLWGIMAPRTAVTAIAPLMNANQLAGYLNIAILLAAGSTLSTYPVMRRFVSIAVVASLTAFEIHLGSRGAVGSLIVGFAIVGWLTRRTRREKRHRRLTETLVIGVTALGAAVLLAVSGSETAASALAETDVSKLAVTRTVLTSMARAYPFFGAGRGAFESTFPEFRRAPGWLVFSHPENLVAQWVSEWGVPITLIAIATLLFALRPSVVTMRARPAIGSFAALVALTLQNLVDFSLEAPGVVISLSVCAALVVGGSGRQEDGSHRSDTRLKTIAKALAVCIPVAALCVLPSAAHDVVGDRQHLQHAIASGGEVSDRDLADAMQRHPAEPYFRYVGAISAARRDDKSVVRWTAATLERAPVYGPAHLILARWLRPFAPAQARLEYRVAQSQGLPVQIGARELAPLVHGIPDALECFPLDAEYASTLSDLSGLLEKRLPATALQVDREVLRRKPGHASTLERGGEHALLDARDPALSPWCGPSGSLCIAAAAEDAERALRSTSGDCRAIVLRARVQVQQGEPHKGMQEALAEVERATDPAACLGEMADVAMQAHDEEDASVAIDALAARYCSTDADCIRNLVTARDLEASHGNPARALVFARRASERAPTREDLAVVRAQLATRLGLRTEAQQVYAGLARTHPDNAEYRRLSAE